MTRFFPCPTPVTLSISTHLHRPSRHPSGLDIWYCPHRWYSSLRKSWAFIPAPCLFLNSWYWHSLSPTVILSVTSTVSADKEESQNRPNNITKCKNLSQYNKMLGQICFFVKKCEIWLYKIFLFWIFNYYQKSV